jgi:ribosomal protein L11 methyltransferase
LKTYTIVSFSETAGQNDLLTAFLYEIGFDSFEEKNENETDGYIESDLYNADAIAELLNSVESLKKISFKASVLENKNWNEEWEKSFEPILVDETCAVRAPFHAPFNTPYEIVIEPRMAFGTGHHATTEMMISLMLNINFTNKKVLDFGCGTAILAILAEKMGASRVFAHDIEEPAEENSISNALLNDCSHIEVKLGGIEVVPDEKFDVILANVTTNVITEHAEALISRLANDGIILFSGILVDQKETIARMARILNLTLQEEKNKNNWVALMYKPANQTK